MNKIGTIAGIPAVFAGRWDDSKENAHFKSKFLDTVVFYDSKDTDVKAHPAPAIAHAMLEVDDRMAAYAVFYHDDEGEIFGSVIFSAGQIAPLSEVLYEDAESWEEAIIRASKDSNIDQVFSPEGAVNLDQETQKSYFQDPDLIDRNGLPKITSSSNIATILIVMLMMIILTAIPVVAWIIVAKPFEKVSNEAEFVVERIKPDYSRVLDQCALDLQEPWPAPPEWNLSQEGCILAPELARVTFPKPVDQRPYSYRFYDLDPQQWDDFLSRASFMRMAERFPGQVLEGTNQFVLYMPYDVEKNVVDNAYIPDTDPTSILRQNFVGAIKLGNANNVSGLKGFTNLELDKTIARLSGKRLTANHVYRNLQNQQTGMEISPERIETRQVRIR